MAASAQELLCEKHCKQELKYWAARQRVESGEL
jgi:hypothetical protein